MEFAEDNYESKISNLDSLVAYIDQDSIHEIWNVTTIEQNKEHFVIAYGNANHLCTLHASHNKRTGLSTFFLSIAQIK